MNSTTKINIIISKLDIGKSDIFIFNILCGILNYGRLYFKIRIHFRDTIQGQFKVKVLHRRVWLWDGKEPEARCWHLIVRKEVNTNEIKYSLCNTAENTGYFLDATSSLLRSVICCISSFIIASILYLPSFSGTRSFIPR